MTKKHFIALADSIRDAQASPHPVQHFNQYHIEVLAAFCKSQNYHFNESRWLNYIGGKCGPNGGAVRKVERAA